MMSSSAIQRVPLARVSQDRTLAVRDPVDQWEGAAALRASLRRCGVVEPVLLHAGAGALRLVAGFRRVALMVELGETEVPALVDDAPLTELFVRAVEAHAGQPLNLRERGRAVAIGRALGLDAADLGRRVLPALGMPSRPHLVEQLERIHRLPPDLLDVLVTKGYSLRRCLPFCALEAAEASLVARVARALRLGGRQVEEVCAWLMEIAAREDRTVAEVIDELGLLAPLEDDPEPQVPPLERIARRRLPETFARRDALRQLCGELAPAQVRFDPSFAREEVELVLQVRSVEELRRLAATLTSPAAGVRLARILELL